MHLRMFHDRCATQFVFDFWKQITSFFSEKKFWLSFQISLVRADVLFSCFWQKHFCSTIWKAHILAESICQSDIRKSEWVVTWIHWKFLNGEDQKTPSRFLEHNFEFLPISTENWLSNTDGHESG